MGLDRRQNCGTKSSFKDLNRSRHKLMLQAIFCEIELISVLLYYFEKLESIFTFKNHRLIQLLTVGEISERKFQYQNNIIIKRYQFSKDHVSLYI